MKKKFKTSLFKLVEQAERHGNLFWMCWHFQFSWLEKYFFSSYFSRQDSRWKIMKENKQRKSKSFVISGCQLIKAS